MTGVRALTAANRALIDTVNTSVAPNAERRLYRKAQQGAGIPGEDVADLGPLVGLQQAAVRGVLDAVAQVHQTPHEDLNIWSGAERKRTRVG